MYYNVVVKNYIGYAGEQLVFHFGDDFEEALKFVNYIAKISEYHIEFLQFKEDDNKEE